jgi:AcrR family transcriptional regulator
MMSRLPETAATQTSDAAPKRLRADARRNRDSVLAAARELFASDGLSVSLDEIARHAGVGPGTVHRHFPAKENLIAAVAIARLEQIVERARKLATADDPGAAFRSHLLGVLAYADDNAALKSALTGTDLDIRTAAPEVRAALRDAVGVLLVRAQLAGAIRDDLDVDDLMALIAGWVHTFQYAGVNAKSRQAQRLTAVFFDGLRLRTDHRT